MFDAFNLYAQYVSVSIRSQMQYRASFIMTTLAHFLMTGLEFLAIWVLFARFEHLGSWRLEEVCLFYGLINMAFALSDATSRGFDMFHTMVKGGDFDRLLVRPRSTVIQLAGQEFTLRRIGRFSQGALVFAYGTQALGIDWTLAKIALAFFTIFGGACLFYGLIVLQATMAFWTTESLEIVNTVTYGGVQTAQYPLTIYRTWFRQVFTYIIPLASVSYYPSLALLDRVDPLGSSLLFQWLSPAIGIAFLIICLQVWHVGVRHYRSTGS